MVTFANPHGTADKSAAVDAALVEHRGTTTPAAGAEESLSQGRPDAGQQPKSTAPAETTERSENTENAGTTEQPTTANRDVTVKQVEDRLAELDRAGDPEGSDKPDDTAAREAYRRALKQLGTAQEKRAEAERYSQLAASAPEEIKDARTSLADQPQQFASPIPDVSLAQMEQAISRIEGEVSPSSTVAGRNGFFGRFFPAG